MQLSSSNRPHVDVPAVLPVVQSDIILQHAAPNKQPHAVHDQPEKLGGHRQTLSRGSFKPRATVTTEQSDVEQLLIAMQTIGQQQHTKLDSCTNGLRTKLEELRELNRRIEDLYHSANELLESFADGDVRFKAEFKAQIESLERFKDEMAAVEALHNRLRAEQEKVEDYERRIERVQAKVERQKEKESRKKRVSWRVRLLWGFAAMFVILWLLATAGSEGDDISDMTSDDEPIKLVPPMRRVSHDLLEFSLE